jgi:hypothetical protein
VALFVTVNRFIDKGEATVPIYVLLADGTATDGGIVLNKPTPLPKS